MGLSQGLGIPGGRRSETLGLGSPLLEKAHSAALVYI